MLRIRPLSRFASLTTLLLATVLLAPSNSGAAEAKKTALKPAAKAAPSTDALATPAGFEALGLPRYAPPPSYSVDLVMKAEGQDMTMKRFIDNGRTRTEISADGQQMTMIELGDEKGTMYIVMPSEKMAMKQSRVAAMEAASKASKKAKGAKEADEQVQAETPANYKVEDLGDDTIEGRAAKKVRFVTDQGPVLGWIDKETGAPMRFESNIEGKKSTIAWENMKVGPQPATLFEVPKGYEVKDMDEMMKSMGGMGGMGGLGGMGMTMAGGMATGYATSLGSSMGSQIGGTLGASFGGPIGMIAGQYIGGKIGGMIGHKAADMVLPGKQ